MTRFTGPLYEISLVITDTANPGLKTWLEDLTHRALRETGVADARIFDSGIDDQGRAVHVCQFRAADDNALDELLDGFFAEVDAEIAALYGDHVLVSSRILREDDSNNLPAVESPNCLNCGTRLRGQYCGVCGQRARNRLISLWELLREAFGDLLELDSRIWRTLNPLLTNPGQLTHDYLQGRRARYMPPFRTYLVLSVLFFVVAFFDPHEGLGLLSEPEPEAAAEETTHQGATGKRDDEYAVPEDDREIIVGFDGDTCEPGDIDLENAPNWIKRRLTPKRLEYICEQFVDERSQKAMTDRLVDNIPVALFVLMPLMALVLKGLYPLSRRYFVEHLLFFVHFHAFFFLILILIELFSSATALVNIDGTVTTLVIVAAIFYIPVYLYKAMRCVYKQGRFMTIIKYIALLIAYAFGVSLTMLGAVLFAVIWI